jgi:hypothetical protein
MLQWVDQYVDADISKGCSALEDEGVTVLQNINQLFISQCG